MVLSHFNMKVSIWLFILVSNILFESTSPEYLNEDQPGADKSGLKADIMINEWGEEIIDRKPETTWRDYLSSIEAGQMKNGDDRDGNEDREHLVGKDYFRLDSEDYDMKNEKLKHNPKKVKRLTLEDLMQYNAEVEAGDITQLFGTNVHLSQPKVYDDLGRRFVLQYPYKEVDVDKKDQYIEENSLTPKLAAPELVLAIAKESAMLEAAKPVNPTEELISKDVLRTGKYWNGFWKEDVDPKISLRAKKRNKMQSVYAQLSPGTELHQLVAKFKQFNPKLLYVINKKTDIEH